MLFIAPIATILPSNESDTEYPELSPPASPSISCPIFTHKLEFELYEYTLTCPASINTLVELFFGAPIATVFPSDDNDTL